MTFNVASWTASSAVSVTLAGPTFKGFYIAAYTAAGTRVGTWDADADTATQCSGGALTHSNANLKTSAVHTWHPPAGGQGTVTFYATAVVAHDSPYIKLTQTLVENTGQCAADVLVV